MKGNKTQKITKSELLKLLKNATNDSIYEMEMVDDNHTKLVLFVTIKASKNQSSMTTKQFQEYVIEFIKEQKLVNQRQEGTNKIVMQRLDNIENEIKLIKSCPTIKKELNL